MPQAGELTERITVTRPLDSDESSQNSFGEDTTDDAAVGTFWASLIFTPGFELASLGQTWAEAKYKITLRDQPGITFTRKMKISWNGRTLGITDVQQPLNSSDPWVVIYARDYDG